MGVPLILQSERAECGLAAMTMIAIHHGHKLDLAAMRRRFGGSAPNLRSILTTAAALGLVARPLRLRLSDMRRLALPAILHWEFDHFVVATRVRRRQVVIHDPATGRRVLDIKDLDNSFTGVAVEFARAADFSRNVGQGLPSASGLLRSFRGLGRYLALMLTMLIVTQVLALVPPVATQLLIDEVVLGQDRQWLYRVIAGIALVMLATVVIDTLRRRVALYTGMRLATDSTTLIIRHLLRLPAGTIERRSVGDLMSRVDSLRPLRTVLTETSLQAIVQGTVILTTIAVMIAYSPVLALLAISALILVALLQVAILPRSRSLNLEALLASARANNSLIESLRAYASVSALGLSTQRLAHWQQGFVAATNAVTRQAQLGVFANAGGSVVNVIEYMLFLGIGIDGVLSKQFTLGVLFAFISLRGRLMVATADLIGAARQLYLVRSHVERVADIVAEEAEPLTNGPAMRRSLRGGISCDGLEFRYPGGPAVIAGFDASIDAGESVVILGPSGAGKSTLLRLLAGALPPDRGSLRYDGIEATLWDRDALRQQFGVVLQSDRLFEGSIADNISCFELTPDLGRIREAAELACIWEELQMLPMTVHTPIAGASAGLSGGQVQRLLLARALYRRPAVLFLDEATSHLDHVTECHVLDNLRSLDVTLVSVAHRRNAIATASRAIQLGIAAGMAIDP